MLRTPVEASDHLRHREILLTEEAVELLDGLLLGDGSLESPTHSESRFALGQRVGREGWVHDVARRLGNNGIPSVVSNRGERGWELRTPKYRTLTRERLRWYPSGVKAVPVDVRLTPLSISQWYWGDGLVENNGYRMGFCTDSFAQEQVQFLASQLRFQYGLESVVRPHQGGFRIYISQRASRVGLVRLLETFCPQCFQYKLNVRGII